MCYLIKVDCTVLEQAAYQFFVNLVSGKKWVEFGIRILEKHLLAREHCCSVSYIGDKFRLSQSLSFSVYMCLNVYILGACLIRGQTKKNLKMENFMGTEYLLQCFFFYDDCIVK